MKKIFTKFFSKVAMAACLATMFASSVWGQTTVTLTQSSLELTGSYTSNTQKTIDGITYVYTDLMKNNDNIQAKASSGVIYNSTAFPGTITSVAITHSGTARATTIHGSSDGTNWTQVKTGSGSITADFSGSSYKYFKITRGSNAAYWTQIAITYSSGSSVIVPSISANNVDIAYNATGGSISYSIENGVNDGSVSAAVTSGDWVSLGSGTASPIAFTCSANDTKNARSATVTLTYTYNTSETVTKAVTITQAANPNILDNISDITVAGTYAVQGTIVAKSQRGFIVGDGTGYVYYYNTSYDQSAYAINDKVKLSGSVVAYGGVFEFNSSTTVTAAATSNYVSEDPTALTGAQMDTRVASTTPAQLSTYVQYQGVLSVSGNYYNVTGIDGANTAKGSISFPINTDFTSLNGKNVIVKGYYVGISSSTYYNTMIGTVEEVVSSTPTITVSTASLSGFSYEEGDGPSTTKSFTVSGSNLTENIALSVSGSDFEISLASDSGYASNLSITPTAGAVAATTVYVRLKAGLNKGDFSATITLSSSGAENQTVSLTGEVIAPVLAYASLPFSFDGGRSDIATTSGLTQDGLDSDYGSSPTLKFNTVGDYVILQINERPGTLTFDIKGNGAGSDPWSGTFKVQTSEDGTSYTDLESYTDLTSTVQNKSLNNLGENVRYIKWIYTVKSVGNVALGNIELAKYVAPAPSITVSPATAAPAASDVTGTLDITYENLTISDMDDFDVQYCDSEGNDATKPEWVNEVLVAEKDPSEGEGYVVSFTIQANDGATRAVYFKIYALDDNTNLVYSNLVTISQAAYVAPATSEQYELFTGTLVEGDYIIYYDGVAMKNTVSNNRLSYETVNPVNEVITTDDASIVWHIAQSGSYWTIFSADANAYAASTGAKNKAQLLNDGTDDKAQWTISGTGTYDFVNKEREESNSDSNNKYLRFNSGYGFACYAVGTGGELSLYKLVAAAPQDEITINATALNGKCWATFYNGTARYTLPAGAKAYTMNADHQLYLLGDGTEIPADTAVIIIADDNNATSITLRKSTKTDTVTVSGTNILVGSDSDVAKTGSQYVLGIKGGVLNFYLFNGTAIPAGKAYYE